jgi:hypothetical protein
MLALVIATGRLLDIRMTTIAAATTSPGLRCLTFAMHAPDSDTPASNL